MKEKAVKPSTPTRASDTLTGYEKQNERNKERAANPATLDHLVTPYDSQESYGELILLTPQPTKGGGEYL